MHIGLQNQCIGLLYAPFGNIGERHSPLLDLSPWLAVRLSVGFRLAIDGTDSAEGVVLDGNRFSPVDPALHP